MEADREKRSALGGWSPLVSPMPSSDAEGRKRARGPEFGRHTTMHSKTRRVSGVPRPGPGAQTHLAGILPATVATAAEPGQGRAMVG